MRVHESKARKAYFKCKSTKPCEQVAKQNEKRRKQFRSIFSKDEAQPKKQSEGLLKRKSSCFFDCNKVLRKKTKKFT